MAKGKGKKKKQQQGISPDLIVTPKTHGVLLSVDTTQLPEPDEAYSANFGDAIADQGMLISVFGQVPVFGADKRISSMLEISIPLSIVKDAVIPSFQKFKDRLERVIQGPCAVPSGR